MQWGPDTGLRIRMAIALVLVFVFPFAFVYAFVFALNTVGIALLELLFSRPYHGEFYVHPLLVGGCVAVGFLAHQVLGTRATLRSIGARRVDPERAPDLHARLTRLAAQADVDPPKLAVSDADAPNAFTIAPRPTDATVVVTEGLRETLSEDELDAVLAHELAHVKNRDVTVMSTAFLLPTVTYLVAMVAWTVLSGLWSVLGRLRLRSSNDDAGKVIGIVILVIVTSAVVSLAISVFFWVGSFLLYRVLARHREFAADRGAAAITGDPPALASALETIDAEMSDMPDRDLRAHDGGLEAMYVAPVDDYQFEAERELISSDLFPESHPPTDERVERLRELTDDLEAGSA